VAKIEKLKRAVIKEELIEAIEYRMREKGMSVSSSYKLAILLNQSLYWTERVGQDKYQKFLVEESRRGSEEVEGLEGGWVYKNADEWAEDCLLKVSGQTVRRWFEKLIKIGYILERNNPKVKFDHTVQYRINLVKIIKDLDKLGYQLEGYKTASLLNLQNGESKIDNGNSKEQNGDRELHNGASNLQNGDTIPEITTESTTDIVVDKAALEKLKQLYNRIFPNSRNMGYHMSVIEQYLQKGLEIDLVINQLEKTGLSDNPNMNYLIARLNGLLSDGITSMSELEARKQKCKPKGGNSNGKYSSNNARRSPRSSKSNQHQSEYGEGCFDNPELQVIDLSIDDL
jgi:hypothetical protein